MKTKLNIIGVVFVLLLIIIAFVQTNNPRVNSMIEKMKEEFSAINNPGESKLESFDISHKANSASLSAEFTNNDKIDKIRLYYVEELEKKGWQIDKGEEVASVKDDRGFMYMTYHKGDLLLLIEGFGSNAYIINIDWERK